jgi:hypothetical protein
MQKITKSKKTGGVVQVVEYLLSKYKALSSNPSTGKEKGRKEGRKGKGRKGTGREGKERRKKEKERKKKKEKETLATSTSGMC